MQRAQVGFLGAPGRLFVEIARDDPDRLRGLSGRPQLDPGTGMLFDMGRADLHGFHMVGVYFPLDMIFVSESGHVVGIQHEAPPGMPGPFVSPQPARWILEAPGGWARAHGIRRGMQMAVL